MHSDYNNIIQTINDLKNAQNNLKRILSEYEDRPKLLNFYAPSAEIMVSELKKHLKYLLSLETELSFDSGENLEPEIWIHLEGKNYNGRGPIGSIGAYLQKLNNANKQAVNLLGNISERFEQARELLSNLASFDLVSTAQGSLKLGLVRSEVSEHLTYEQLDLFYDEEPLESVKSSDIKLLKELSLEGIKLIAHTVAAVEDETLFESLKKQFGEKELKKLIHYTKELVPSMRSSFDTVSFESNSSTVPFSTIKATKSTRKALIEKEKTLMKDSKYISGEGWIRAVDIDGMIGTIRPLHYDDITLHQIDCIFSDEKYNSHNIANLLDKFVIVKGFLISNQHETPIKFDIEEIILKEELVNEVY
ncbi:hypothetical protein KD050_18935 [Psychrobacillus sp. INOP01]|uniref:hypothetical protein n=1 Tax=Psychrobacillus sp. INOP01 TaxID=2829187 RepID=UPI001BA8FAF7|nr:hypothetical protein [Psychrobacillus sp. INOP01]QUG41326.1 hypothetical protein KD050_18935 [Psychrobacillus sp. INOP01]